MNLTLNADLQKLIDDRVRSGKYATPEDVVAAAISTLDQHERPGDFDVGELDALLEEGERNIEEHGTLDGDEAYHMRKERRSRLRDKAS